MQSLRVLITGSNGLLGQALLHRFSSKKGVHQVLATSKGPPRGLSATISYESLDITKVEDVRQLCQAFKPHSILHTAALTHVDTCETEQQKAYQINVQGVQSLLSEAEKLRSFFLHLSTDFVFDGLHAPYVEESSLAPCNYYGRTKQLAEAYIRQSTCAYAILRTSLVYGRVRAESTSLPILLWAKEVLRKSQSVHMITDQWRMPTFVEDLAEACLAVLQCRATGIYHVCGKEVFTPYEMIRTAATFWNLPQSLVLPTDTVSLPSKARRPRDTRCVLTKAFQQLNYRPRSFIESLKKMEKTA